LFGVVDLFFDSSNPWGRKESLAPALDGLLDYFKVGLVIIDLRTIFLLLPFLAD
jgi:hypothetical protein